MTHIGHPFVTFARYVPTTMDRDSLYSALLSIAVIAERIGEVRQDLPPGERAARLAEILGEAQLDLTVAQATIAREVGLELDRAHWPPRLRRL